MKLVYPALVCESKQLCGAAARATKPAVSVHHSRKKSKSKPPTAATLGKDSSNTNSKQTPPLEVQRDQSISQLLTSDLSKGQPVETIDIKSSRMTTVRKNTPVDKSVPAAGIMVSHTKTGAPNFFPVRVFFMLILCRSGMLFGVPSKQTTMCIQCPELTLSLEHLSCCGSFEWPGFKFEQQEGTQRMVFNDHEPLIQLKGQYVTNHDYIGSVLLSQLSDGDWLTSADQSHFGRGAEEEGGETPRTSQHISASNHLFSILAGVLQR